MAKKSKKVPSRQHILDGSFLASPHATSEGPWTHHYEDDNGRTSTAQYWLPGQDPPTGDMPKHPKKGYKAGRERAEKAGWDQRGMREGFPMGHFQGFHDAYDDVEMGGQAYARGFQRGMPVGGMFGYDNGYDDYAPGGYFDDHDGGFDGYGGYDGYDEGYGGYGGYDGGYDGYDEYGGYDDGYGGGYDGGYGGYGGGFGGYGFY